MPAYVEHLLVCRARDAQAAQIVVNAGNGGAGLIVDKLEPLLPFELIKVQHEPDGTFPNGVPNPLLEENHRAPAEAVRAHGADLARSRGTAISTAASCSTSTAISSRATTSSACWRRRSCAAARARRIVHDPRLTWNTIDIVRALGGSAVQSKTGHAFIKERMRAEDAIYGGEMSAHHYFRDFAYCDSGMIPWLLVTQLMCERGLPLSALVEARDGGSRPAARSTAACRIARRR